MATTVMKKAIFSNDLDACWMPFGANLAFKQTSSVRIFSSFGWAVPSWRPILVTAMVVYGVATTTANAFSYFYFALGYRRLLFTQIAMMAIKLPLSILLLPLIGNAGAIFGTTVGYLLALVIPSLLMLGPILANLAALWGKGPAVQIGVEFPAMDC
jgi:hypothetical protein